MYAVPDRSVGQSVGGGGVRGVLNGKHEEKEKKGVK